MTLPLPSPPLAGHSLVSWVDGEEIKFGCHCGAAFSRLPVVPGVPDLGVGDGRVLYPELAAWFGMHGMEVLGANVAETPIDIQVAIDLGVANPTEEG